MDSDRQRPYFGLTASMAVFAALAPGVALAQTAQSQPPAQSARPADDGVGEVVVTAQKREQQLQDVPGAVSALTAQQLQDEGLRSVQDIATRIPGITFGTSIGGSFITMRGVGVGVDTGVAEPNTAVYVDGVYLPRTTIQQLNPIDLGRVEVLRGPQGTLYGRNATGGAVNYISQAPSREFGGEVDASYGNFDTVQVDGRVTGPLTDSLRGSLSGGYYNRGTGYIDNRFTGGTLDKAQRFNLRGALAGDLTEKLSFDASVSYEREIFQTTNALVRPPGPFMTFLIPAPVLKAPFGPWEAGSDFSPNSHRSTLLGRVQLDYQLTPDISVKSITGYINHKFTNRLDGDGTSAGFDTVTDRQGPSESASQEFNLSGALPNKGSWLVGAYVFHENALNDFPVNFPIGFPAFSLPPSSTLIFTLHEDTLAMAAFTDVTLGLTDRFRVYGGARVARDEKKSLQTVGFNLGGFKVLSCQNHEIDQTFNSVSPRIGAQYDVSEDAMVYAQYSQGYKSGGVNSAACDDTYDPERLRAEEAGFKTQWLNRHLTLNGSVFHYEYTGFQLLQIVGVAAAITNADTRVWGAELESNYRLNDTWRIDASATYLDSKFTKFSNIDSAHPGLGNQDLRGKRTPRAPELSANFGVEGRFPLALGPFELLTVRADARYSDQFYIQPFNIADYQQGAYTLVDLNAVLATAGDGYRVRGFVRNATNEEVLGHVAYNVADDTFFGNYLAPRTYGIEISHSF